MRTLHVDRSTAFQGPKLSYAVGKPRKSEAGTCREMDNCSKMIRKQTDVQRFKERERD